MADAQDPPFVSRHGVVTYDPWTAAAEGLAEAVEDFLAAHPYDDAVHFGDLRVALDHYNQTTAEYEKP